MNALIKTQNGIYCSTVFAHYYKPKKMAVIVFDESNSRLILVNYVEKQSRFRYKTNAIIADDSQDEWVKNKKWCGFDFLVNDKNILKSIKLGENVDETVLNKCKALQTTETFTDWNNLNTESDIRTLMNLAYNFHDSALESVINDGIDTYVKFYCCDSYITIKFTNVLSSNKGDGISWVNNSILEAIMHFENGNIKWFVDSFAFEEYENQECYFIAEKAQYKINII